MSPLQQTLLVLLPEISLLLTIFVTLFFDLFTGMDRRSLRWMSMAGLVLSLMFTLQMQFGLEVQNVRLVEQVASVLIIDKMSLLLKSTVAFLALATLWFSDKALEDEEANNHEFSLLIMFASLGGMLCLSAAEFITFFLSFELLSLPLYCLAAYRRYQSRSAEAGLKYFVMGALSSAIMLFGMSWIFGATGSTQFMQIARAFETQTVPNHAFIVGILMVIVGLAFKVSAAPFHSWAPDVYVGAPTLVSGYLSTAPKAAIVGFILRLCWTQLNISGNFNLPLDWLVLFAILSLLSMFIGNLTAVPQTDCKRILAYSGIAQIGYVLLGVVSCSTAYGAGALAFGATLYYVIGYTVANLLAWVSLALALKDQPQTNIDNLSGLVHRSPLLATCLVFSLMSLAGVPPLAGFVGKFGIFLSIYQAKLPFLVIFGIINSVISLYYYFRMLKSVFFGSTQAPAIELSGSHRALLQLMCIGVFALGLWPGLLNLCQSIAQACMR